MNDPTRISRRAAVGGVAAGLLVSRASAQDPIPDSEPRTATVIVVRHAEKTTAKDDPELSATGRARATMLADVLQAAGIARIFTTDYRRTRETVAPTARQTGIPAEVYDPRDSAAFAATLAQLDSGTVALVAGHSNTVPAITRALGGDLAALDEHGHLDEREYDRFVILTLGSMSAERPMRALHTLDLRLTIGG